MEPEPDTISLRISDSSHYFGKTTHQAGLSLQDLQEMRSRSKDTHYSISSLSLDSLSSSEIPLTLFGMCKKRKRDQGPDEIVEPPSVTQIKPLLASADELLRHAWALHARQGSSSGKSTRLIAALESILNKVSLVIPQSLASF